MKYILLMVLLIGLTGCGVSSKVISIERVDQEMTGNRGIIYGEVPEVNEKRKVRQRKILEVNVTKIFK